MRKKFTTLGKHVFENTNKNRVPEKEKQTRPFGKKPESKVATLPYSNQYQKSCWVQRLKMEYFHIRIVFWEIYILKSKGGVSIKEILYRQGLAIAGIAFFGCQ